MKKMLLFTLFPSLLFAQNSDSQKGITLSGYSEIYISHNTSPLLKNSAKQFDFNYNHNAQNHIALNLAMGKIAYASTDIRANFAIMTGTYANANTANEPSVAKMILEANAGVKLSAKKNIWLDAGVMPSHIGYEGAICKDNITLTRSLMAENSPYYETGARLSYTSANEKLYVATLLLNGWQTIIPSQPTGINFGAQFTYQASKHLKLNYSNFFNTNTNSSRMYHDVYAEYTSNKTKLVGAFDYGVDVLSNVRNPWLTFSVMAQQKVNIKNAIAGRAEYFFDRSNSFLFSKPNYFITPLSFSINYDYYIKPNALLRFEPKVMIANQGYAYTIPAYYVFTSSLNIHF